MLKKICTFSVYYLLLSAGGVLAQTVPPPRPNPVFPTPTPQPIPLPLTPSPPPLQINPPLPTNPEVPENVPQPRFTVERFEFVGNTAFSQKQLEQITKEFTGYPITFPQLLQAASKVTDLYLENGYITSGAYIYAPQTLPTGSGVVKILVVEGSVEEIKVKVVGRLNPNYVRSRLRRATSKPLNRKRLQEALQLLQLNPLISTITAELSAGTRPGTNILTITVTEANTFNARFFIDNSNNPSVGTFRRGLQLTDSDYFGIGDNLNLEYDNSTGSNNIAASYTLPINASNGTLNLSYSQTWSNIVEPPFDVLNIHANSRSYEVTLRQPIQQTATQDFTQEIALGLTANRRESNTTLLGVPFPVSVGADFQGNTQISALRFFQDLTRRSRQQVFLARSQFSLGLGAFDATVHNKPPDSRFFAWRGQLQWLRLLGGENNPQVAPKILVRTDVQVATRALVPLEQFTIGGPASVRGYRQDAVLSDNGAFFSTELQLPIYSTLDKQGVLQILPFFDIGTTWNNSGNPNLDPSTLAALGLGLMWGQPGDRFTARLDYGIPLIPIKNGKRTWQENGVTFSVQYNLF